MSRSGKFRLGMLFFFLVASSGKLCASLCGDQANSHYAWFVDRDRQVNYCIQRDDNFSDSNIDARQIIEDAVQTWREYYEHHSDIKDMYRYSTNFVYSEICNSDIDLVFYLGVDSEEVKRAPEYHEFSNPDYSVSFQHLSEYDIAKGFGKGFVWFSGRCSNWNREFELRAGILHHLGHILGNDHVPGTIMQESIVPGSGSDTTEEQRAIMSISIDQTVVVSGTG